MVDPQFGQVAGALSRDPARIQAAAPSVRNESATAPNMPIVSYQSPSGCLAMAEPYRPGAARQLLDAAFIAACGGALGVVVAAYLWSSP